jgi:hypothetical protein
MGGNSRDRTPSSTSAEVEIPGRQKKFLFLLLFLLAKGEKEETYALDKAWGCCISRIFSKCDSPF